MATFGPIASAAPNVLFNPMAVDQAVQGRQRNQLMMDSARQDQQQQTFQRDATARISLARQMADAPDLDTQWGPAVRQMQAAGLGQGLDPNTIPPRERLRAIGASDLTTFQRMQMEHQRQNSAFSFGPGGGAPVAAPASAPTAAPMAGVPPELMPHFEEASRATGVPVPLLIAQAQQESGFRPDATGRSGEVGIMQIMPSTAQQPGFGMQGVDPATLRDPRANIMFGAQYLAARNQGTNWNDPAQRDAGLGRYNGGGDPNYAANVTRNLPSATGPAARTGGTDMAGPGVPAAPAAADAPRMLYRGSSPFTEGLPSGQAWGQTADGRRVAMDIPGARMPRQPAEPGGPFGGTGMDAQVSNIMLRIGPKVANGTATDEERQQYALAHGHMTRGTTQLVDDGKGGQVLARIPGVVPEGFPAPSFRPGAAQPTDAATAPEPGAAQPIPGTARAAHPTADQSKVATFAERIAAALPIITENAAAGASPADRALSHVPLVGNYLTTEGFQKADQAQRDFINAVLRRESGAAISESEFDNARQQYFPQPGNPPAVLEQKRQNRERVLSGFQREAGPAHRPSATPEAPTPNAPPLPPGFTVVQ